MLLIVSSVFLVLYWISDGHLKPQHWAFGGAAALPVMVTVLALIIMESEALNDAKKGVLPNWVKEKYPDNSLEPINVDILTTHNDEIVKA